MENIGTNCEQAVFYVEWLMNLYGEAYAMLRITTTFAQVYKPCASLYNSVDY